MLGLGANISGGSPVGASGVAAPPPPSDYIYESDFTTDSFLNTSVSASVVDHEGRSDVLKFFNNTLAFFNSRNFSVNLSPGSYEIDFWYYVPSGSTLEELNVYKRYGSTRIIAPDEIQYDQWVNLTHDFNIDRETFFLILFETSSASSGDSIFISDIKISLNIATSPSPPPGGYYDGALDQSSVSYEGAAAAYSLRLVYSYYDGSAIRVRRASDNTEQDIGFSNGVLDTSTLSTFCSGTDGFVKVWYDQANGNDATQTTTGLQPKIYDASAGMVTDNGNPAFDFNGSSHQLVASVTISSAAASTSFVVVNPDTVSPNKRIYNMHDGAAGDERNSTFFNSQFNIFDGTNGLSTGTAVAGTQYVITSRFVTGDGTIHANGTLQGTSAAITQKSVNTLSIGKQDVSAAFYFDGSIQEIIIYPSDQSANRAGIEANINDFYSIYS